MKPRITVLTLGVTDLEASVEFYKNGLGLPSEGIIGKEFENGAVAFFDLQNNLKLALWPRKSILIDTNLEDKDPSGTEFTIGHNVSTKEEVDEVMFLAKSAGAKIIKSAQDTFYGGLQDISRTLINIYGKLYGIQHLKLKNKFTKKSIQPNNVVPINYQNFS